MKNKLKTMECNYTSLVMPEYNEPDADQLPLNEDGTTIMGDNLESKARQDVYRKHLERQRSREFDRSALYCLQD